MSVTEETKGPSNSNRSSAYVSLVHRKRLCRSSSNPHLNLRKTRADQRGHGEGFLRMYVCELKIVRRADRKAFAEREMVQQADWNAFVLESGDSPTAGIWPAPPGSPGESVGLGLGGQRSIVAQTSDLAPAPVNQLYILVSGEVACLSESNVMVPLSGKAPCFHRGSERKKLCEAAYCYVRLGWKTCED
jgi:hypothetical protein